MRTPKAFGDQPVGCAMQPVRPLQPKDLTERPANWYAAAEDELCGIYDVGAEYTGRAATRVVEAPAISAVKAERAVTTPLGRALRGFAEAPRGSRGP